MRARPDRRRAQPAPQELGDFGILILTGGFAAGLLLLALTAALAR